MVTVCNLTAGYSLVLLGSMKLAVIQNSHKGDLSSSSIFLATYSRILVVIKAPINLIMSILRRI